MTSTDEVAGSDPRPRGQCLLIRLAVVAAFVGWLTLAAGCAGGPSEASTLASPRFLAASTTPSAVVFGTEVEIDVLAWDVTEVSWSGCDEPWVGTVDGLNCPTDAVSVGTGVPLVLVVDHAVHLLAQDASGRVDAAPPMVVAIDEGGPDHNLEVTGIVGADGLALTSVVAEEELEVAAQTADEVSTGGVTTFYASAGEFSPWRKAGTESSMFVAPADPGDVTIITVVRETNGAVGWATTSVTVVAP